MGVVSVNEKDVKLVNSGHGQTKWLVPSKNGASPEMMIRHWGPDTNIPVHSHPYHEMFYVSRERSRSAGRLIRPARASMSRRARLMVRHARPRGARC